MSPNQSGQKIRVLVVDDSAYNRQTIKSMLQSDEDIEVVAIASDGMDAMSKTLKLAPDVITLDFEMPEMDGFAFLRWLMHNKPTPVIMVSSYSDDNMAFKALEMGAVDFIAKPTRRASSELKNIEKDLLHKVKSIRQLNMEALHKHVLALEAPPKAVAIPAAEEEAEVIAIGSSTGGPSALQQVLTHLPADLPSAIVISQHMPKGFTAPFAERLNKLCSLRVKEAATGDVLEKGKVYICPGGSHMQFKRTGEGLAVVLKESTFEDKYVPSVDLMMVSAAELVGRKTLGIILTGMGNDGRTGMVTIRNRGGYTIAESEETSVVFGMPQEAIKANAVKKILPLDRIAGEIRRVLLGERRG